jgi:ketosteroid isomerase-like protein
VKLLSALLVGVIAVVTGGAIQFPGQPSRAMASLVETERAFAKMSVAQGRRAAFLRFFAEDAVFLAPEPANALPLIRAWPAAGPFTLDWEPRFGDVADAADIGYTTGPFVRTSPDGRRTLGTGWYFTVWKMQPDATWKAVIDAGIASPPAGSLRPAPFQVAAGDTLTSGQATAPLREADRALCDSFVSSSLSAALAPVIIDTTRLYRQGLAPITGAAAIRSYLTRETGIMRCDPTKSETAHSGDLGYAYGKYSINRAFPESGWYLRLWKRLAGEWKLAIDVLIPAT